jgi:hypothetical protein
MIFPKTLPYLHSWLQQLAFQAVHLLPLLFSSCSRWSMLCLHKQHWKNFPRGLCIQKGISSQWFNFHFSSLNVSQLVFELLYLQPNLCPPLGSPHSDLWQNNPTGMTSNFQWTPKSWTVSDPRGPFKKIHGQVPPMAIKNGWWCVKSHAIRLMQFLWIGHSKCYSWPPCRCPRHHHVGWLKNLGISSNLEGYPYSGWDSNRLRV